MSHSLAPHVPMLAMSGWLCSSAMREIPEAQADRRLHPATNTPRDIAMHVTMSRHGLARLLGAAVDPLPWKDVGQGYEAGFAPGGERPPMATIREAWSRLEHGFAEILLATTPETLRAPSPIPIAGTDAPTLADFAALAVVHESYHAGQLGLCAKAITGKGLLRALEGKQG